MNSLEIITTSDGSHTLRNTAMDETYHSVHGAKRESLHVFIASGLEYFIQTRDARNISILEVGFGTGLNTLLTLQYAVRNHLEIHYTTLEPFPLTEEVWSRLNYTESEKDSKDFRALHEAGWDNPITTTPEFTLLKLKMSLLDLKARGQYDVVFFDAFAPAKQPELWSVEALRRVIASLKPGGIFVTYSAKGQLKRDLKSLGVAVETLPGPPGKKEMVRAVLVS
ncbi:MAG: tRNA (5-methylaminomethyl-2-thiouridine)(34)-methyltransferase MnmD [Chryseosolibacter sp.]